LIVENELTADRPCLGNIFTPRFSRQPGQPRELEQLSSNARSLGKPSAARAFALQTCAWSIQVHESARRWFSRLRAFAGELFELPGLPGWAGESRSENISEARRSAVNSFFDDQPRCLRFYHFLALRSCGLSVAAAEGNEDCGTASGGEFRGGDGACPANDEVGPGKRSAMFERKGRPPR